MKSFFYLYTYIDIFASVLENMHAVFHWIRRHFSVVVVVVANDYTQYTMK